MKKMSTVIQKIRDALKEANTEDGTTGMGLKPAKNPYFPHEYNAGDNERMEEMWWNDLWRKGNKKKNKALRQQMYKKYNVLGNVQKIIENDVEFKENDVQFEFLNQGHVGGCFMTSVLNLLQLGGKKEALNEVLDKYGKMSLKKLSNDSNFQKMYLTNMKLNDCGYNTYKQPLESLEEKTPDLMALTTDIGFQWFRWKALARATRRKGPYNPNILENPSSTEAYNEEVLKVLRKLIDDGYVFATPFNGHFVAYIGYNDKGFLALGSYGENADKGGFHEVKEAINLADAVNSVLYTKVPDMTMEELSKQVKMITVEKVAEEAKETMKEIQKARTRRGRKKLSKKKKKAPTKKKKGKMTLGQYKIFVEPEVKDMQKLLVNSAKRREEQIKSIIVTGRRKYPEEQRKSIIKTLQACVCVESNGSGSIVTHNGDTFVLTNQHVALEPGTIKFIMWIDGKIGYAETYWVDEERDIGKMRIIDSPKNKVISSLSIHNRIVHNNQLVVQVHNPYHWYNDENTGARKENEYHFPFTVETRKLEVKKNEKDFSHSTENESSVYFGSSGSPLLYRSNNGILGGVIGIHKQWDEITDDFQGVLINDITLRVLPKLKF